MEKHEAQNKRMRDWFEERTGLKDALLSEHMAKMDEMLAIPIEPPVILPKPRPSFGEWVKVTEKMPKTKTLVLITNYEYLDPTKPRYVSIGQYEKESDKWYDEQWQDLFEPDYWMPLPKTAGLRSK